MQLLRLSGKVTNKKDRRLDKDRLFFVIGTATYVAASLTLAYFI